MILAVDGGATKTLALVMEEDGAIVKGLGIAGPSNFTSVTKREIISNLKKAIEESCNEAGIEMNEVNRGLFGIAGIGDSSKITRFGREIIEELTGRKDFKVINDGQPAYAMANLGHDGIMFAGGTGSVCFFKKGKKTERRGGWGWFAGDDGSASWIARKALNIATMEFDGLFEKKSLVREVEDYFDSGFKDAISLAETKYDKRYIAGFAPRVTKLAIEGYGPAISIMEESAEYISSLVKSLLPKFSEPPMISLVGGTMMAGNIYVNMIRNKIKLPLNVYYGYQVAAGGLLLIMEKMGRKPTVGLKDFILKQIDKLLYKKNSKELKRFLNIDSVSTITT